jgi:hypothetical protein
MQLGSYLHRVFIRVHLRPILVSLHPVLRGELTRNYADAPASATERVDTNAAAPPSR